MAGQTIYVVEDGVLATVTSLEKKVDRLLELLSAPKTAPEEPWYTTEEICEKLRISRPTLVKMREKGQIDAMWMGENSPRYRLPK